MSVVTVPPLGALSDAALLARQDQLLAERRRVDAELVTLAGEIARRSTREHGFDGFAQQAGYRSVERYLEASLGVSAREAAALVRVGSLDADAGSRASELLAAVICGAVSVLQADDDLRAAERAAESAAARERVLRDRRFLRMHRQDDGMTRIVGLLDPESAAVVRGAYDAITSPRRGGARAVSDSADRERSERIIADPRTTEQFALDSFVDLIRIGAVVDHSDPAVERRIIGVQLPAVRIHVTDADLTRRAGAANIEGEQVAVSIATAERLICAVGTVPIRFDSAGQVVNVGRDHRLFTSRQRIGLAARDGGCRWPGCDRPPTWCEAHHLDEWKAHGGRTDIADGILLCRFHHLLVHDQGWRIRRGTDPAGHLAYTATHPDGRAVDLPAKV